LVHFFYFLTFYFPTCSFQYILLYLSPRQISASWILLSSGTSHKIIVHDLMLHLVLPAELKLQVLKTV
jgi:hypothetical protein